MKVADVFSVGSMWMEWINKVIQGDSKEILQLYPQESVHTIICSPPYWNLRDYGRRGQLGFEGADSDYVNDLVDIFNQAYRVLRDDGTLWINIGDTSKNKELLGIPWRLALKLQDNGWHLRSDIIWSKKNPMPEACTDRPSKAHEYVFLFSKSLQYYYDMESIREKTGANKRSVWSVSNSKLSNIHYATFPDELIAPMVQAGTSQHGCCSECGAPFERIKEPTDAYNAIRGKGFSEKNTLSKDAKISGFRGVDGCLFLGQKYKTIGWKETCEHKCDNPTPAIVMDIFMGSGTTAMVAKRCGRYFTGIELNGDYINLINERLNVQQKELFE